MIPSGYFALLLLGFGLFLRFFVPRFDYYVSKKRKKIEAKTLLFQDSTFNFHLRLPVLRKCFGWESLPTINEIFSHEYWIEHIELLPISLNLHPNKKTTKDLEATKMDLSKKALIASIWVVAVGIVFWLLGSVFKDQWTWAINTPSSGTYYALEGLMWTGIVLFVFGLFAVFTVLLIAYLENR